MQRSTGKTVLTGFDPDTWHRLGIAWVCGLMEFAKWKGDVCVVDDGLGDRARKFLAAHEIRTVPVVRNFKTPRLNQFLTAMNAATGTVAYWDNASYFQSGFDELFDIAAEDVVASLSGSLQPSLRSTLEVFGYRDADCLAPAAMYSTLLATARSNGTTLQGQFVAGPSNRLAFFAKFTEFHVKHGYLSDSERAIDLSLNLFYAADPEPFTIDSRWSEVADSRWVCDRGIYRDGELVKVVSFPADLVYSSCYARFHLLNSNREAYLLWENKYRSQFRMPRRLLAKTKEHSDEEKAVQVRPGS